MTHSNSTTASRSRVVLRDAATGCWLHYMRPVSLVVAGRIEEVVPALRSVEEAVEREGVHAAGFVSYEAAPAFDPALRTKTGGNFPLLWFQLYRDPEESEDLPASATAPAPSWDWRPSVTRAEYQRGFEAIREFIRNGDTYQVNFTYRMRARAWAEPWDLFLRLVDAQQATCGAFVDTGEWVVCSASPELFFRLDGEDIESRPMKGTAPRGLWFADTVKKPGHCAAP